MLSNIIDNKQFKLPQFFSSKSSSKEQKNWLLFMGVGVIIWIAGDHFIFESISFFGLMFLGLLLTFTGMYFYENPLLKKNKRYLTLNQLVSFAFMVAGSLLMVLPVLSSVWFTVFIIKLLLV